MPPIPSDGGPLAYVADLDAPLLDADDHHHLARVRRLRTGDPLVLGDGAGRWRHARFADVTPEVTGPVEHEVEPSPELTVAFALVKGEKPELVVQKLVELGIDVVRPFVAARSVVRWDEAKVAAAHARWQRVAREAAMQSRRSRLAIVEPLSSFAVVAALPGACLADRAAALAPGAEPAGPSLAHPVVLVGPEGGWDDTERGVALPVVGLGPGVLRAETAAIAAGVLLAAARAGLTQP